MARVMAGLSSESLVRVSKLVGLEGTGEKFLTPLFYKAIMSVAPPLVRSISNVRYEGLDRIPSSGPAILAGNHTSHIDPIVKIMGARRPVHYLAKAEHFDDATMSKLMTSTGQIETERDIGAAGALARAVDVLGSGGLMGIFPEGTRSRRSDPPFLARGKTGVARLAARFPDVPVVPMAILGARSVIAPGNPVVNPFARVEVIIDEPISFGDWLADPKGGDLNDQNVENLLSLDVHGQRSIMRAYYRGFTDQLIETLRRLGAP